MTAHPQNFALFHISLNKQVTVRCRTEEEANHYIVCSPMGYIDTRTPRLGVWGWNPHYNNNPLEKRVLFEPYWAAAHAQLKIYFKPVFIFILCRLRMCGRPIWLKKTRVSSGLWTPPANAQMGSPSVYVAHWWATYNVMGCAFLQLLCSGTRW